MKNMLGYEFWTKNHKLDLDFYNLDDATECVSRDENPLFLVQAVQEPPHVSVLIQKSLLTPFVESEGVSPEGDPTMKVKIPRKGAPDLDRGYILAIMFRDAQGVPPLFEEWDFCQVVLRSDSFETNKKTVHALLDMALLTRLILEQHDDFVGDFY